MEKKVPMRTCIACKAVRPKNELIRIVDGENGISLDKTGKADGRGAYICNDTGCIKKLIKLKSLNRTFKKEVDVKVYEAIERDFNGKE